MPKKNVSNKHPNIDTLTADFTKLAVSKADKGYESENEQKPKKMRPRKRLLVGEADFSYAEALTKKHPEIASAVTATAYETHEDLEKTYPDTFLKNITTLNQKGMSLFVKADARKLDQYQTFKDKKFDRIHFNCPHDKSDFNDQTLPKLLKEFFENASKLQVVGNRVHIALPKVPDDLQKDQFYKGCVYGIYRAARLAGYKQLKPRNFGPERYEGYAHKITGQNSSASVTECLREYIFEKTDLTPDTILQQDRQSQSSPPVYRSFFLKKANYHLGTYCLPELSTDEESSDYFTTDSEQEAPTLRKLTG